MSHEFRLPDIGEGLTEADIVHWFVAVGDEVAVDQPVVEIETAKTTVEIVATHPGTLAAQGGAVGDTVSVGDILFVVGGSGETPSTTAVAAPPDDTTPETPAAPPPHPPASEPAPADAGVRAMPIVRKLAKERGIDLATVVGSGPGGAITRADLDGAHAPATHHLTPMSRIRKAIADHMTQSWTTIPHVTVQAEVRAEALLDARSASGIPIEALVGQVALPLLVTYPEFNARFHTEGVEYRTDRHLGFAVDTEDGLIVVVVRNADQQTTTEVGDAFAALADAAHSGSLSPGDTVGQTFTISNIGALGGGHGTPIIPLGTSAIVSIGRAKPSPVVEDGVLGVGMVAPLDLSYDHRLIDGGLGQRFLADLVAGLESIELD